MYIAKDNARTQLAALLLIGGTTAIVNAGKGALYALGAGEYTYATLFNGVGDYEHVKVTARATDDLTITRAQGGTAAREWPVGTYITCRPIAAALADYAVAPQINTATEETSIADADELGFVDVSDSNKLKKITAANVKAWIKAYLDTLYATIAGFTLTGKLIFKAGLNNIASAETVDLTAATSNTAHITGTTGIGAFTMTSGQVIDLVFDGALTLTHHATTNNLPGAASITTAAGDRARYWYDGTAVWCVAYQKASGAALVAPVEAPPVRQTVLSGPVDSSGLPNFGGATGSTTVTATGTLKATAAAGGDANYTGSIVDPSWTGLSTNGTMYLYLDITSAGVVTTGSTALAPNYQWGGAYSTTNGQHTFNIQEMTMKAGNGSAASQVTRVFVGEVTVSGGVVTAITWYALMGRYAGTSSSVPSNAVVSKTHNLGVVPQKFNITMRNVTTELGYAAGEEVSAAALKNSAIQNTGGAAVSRLAMQYGSDTTNLYLPAKASGANTIITNGNWGMSFYAERGW